MMKISFFILFTFLNAQIVLPSFQGIQKSHNTSSNQITLEFSSNTTSGLSISGQMRWHSSGHLYCNNFTQDSYINFSSPTNVVSFQMNARPWENYSRGQGSQNIIAYDSNNNSIWSTTVNLTSYTAWTNWLTVNVNTDNVSKLHFQPTGSFWPSIDNVVIEE